MHLSILNIIILFHFGKLFIISVEMLSHWGDHERIVEIVDIDGYFSIYCDKTTNMAYLFYIAGHKSAITAYLNADGNPARCNEVRR